MYELVYCSFAKDNLDAAEIAAILKTADAYNAQHHITGCLLYHKHEFIQILEGEQEAVQTLFSKINKDKRHYDLQILAAGEKPKRMFNNWNMAYHHLSDEEVQDFDRDVFVDNFITFSKFAEKRSFPTKLFWSKACALLEA